MDSSQVFVEMEKRKALRFSISTKTWLLPSEFPLTKTLACANILVDT